MRDFKMGAIKFIEFAESFRPAPARRSFRSGTPRIDMGSVPESDKDFIPLAIFSNPAPLKILKIRSNGGITSFGPKGALTDWRFNQGPPKKGVLTVVPPAPL